MDSEYSQKLIVKSALQNLSVKKILKKKTKRTLTNDQFFSDKTYFTTEKLEDVCNRGTFISTRSRAQKNNNFCRKKIRKKGEKQCGIVVIDVMIE